jgi:hypothetical protein
VGHLALVSRPDRPIVDPDVVARYLHDDLGRPTTIEEYTVCWNATVDSTGTGQHITHWENVA